MNRLLFVALFILLTASPRHIRSDVGAFPFPLDPLEALRSTKQSDPARWTDADLVVLDQIERVRYAPSGTSTSWHESCTLVLTEKGRRELGELSLKFFSNYATIEVARVEIVKPNGHRHSVNVRQTSRLGIHAGQMAENIYDPAMKVLVVGVPGIETGDVVYVSFIERRHRVRIPDHWYDVCVLEGTAPIERAVYEVEAPAIRPLRHRVVRDQLPGTLRYEEEPWDAGTRHRWIASGVPRMFPEPDMPPTVSVLQRVLVSTCEDWPSISRWYWNLCRPRMAPDDELRRVVAELVRARPSEFERADALFTFVSQQIRYLGITAETEAPGYEPHAVVLTLRQRHGVCRDKAALLAAMAIEAGLQGFPVLIHAGMLLDPEVPMPYFNHAISAIRFSDGAVALLDPTDESTREWLPSYLAHSSYLMATPQGEPLRISPTPLAASNLVQLATESTLTTNGQVRGQCEALFLGINDTVYRNYLARRGSEERRRLFEAAAQLALPGCRITQLDIDPPDLRDRSRPLRARWQFHALEPVVRVGPIAFVAPPSFAVALGIVHRDLDALSLDHRRFPLRLRSTGGVEETMQLHVGQALGKLQSMPFSRDLELPTVRWSNKWVPIPDGIAGQITWHFTQLEIEPLAYPAFRETVRRVVADQRRRALFDSPTPSPPLTMPRTIAPPPPVPDLHVLHHATDVVWLAPGAWAVTNDVEQLPLTYAGAKRSAELKLPFLEGHDDARLLLAEVISTDGTTNSPGPHDVQIMDQDWTAAAPRYSPGRLLVVGLPAIGPGVRIRYRTVTTYRNRPFVAEVPLIGMHDPIQSRVVRLHAPTNCQLRIAEPTTGGPLLREEQVANGMRMVTWRADQITPLAREPAGAPPWLLGRGWRFSDGDWSVYSRRFLAVLEQSASAATQVAEYARTIAPASWHITDRIRVIRDSVAQRIRITGPTFSWLPLQEITAADRTWSEGYGHSADRAIVLVAMLRAIGLKPKWVPTTELPAAVTNLIAFNEIPWLAPFDRVLVRLRDSTGGDILLNDTDQYAALGVSPSWGKLALDLYSGRIVPLPEPANVLDRIETEFEIDCEPNGTAYVVRRTRMYGLHQPAYAREIHELTPEELCRRDRAELCRIALDADFVAPPMRRLNEHPAIEELRFRIPHLAQQSGPWWYMEPPIPEPTWPGIHGDSRTQPIYWNRPLRERLTVRLRPPPGVELVAGVPQPLRWSRENLGEVWTENYQEDNGALRWTCQIEFTAGLKPAEDFDDLRGLVQQLRHVARRAWVGRSLSNAP